MENEKTKRIAEHLKTVLLPDPVHDAVDRKVKFQARHGPVKHQLLSLDTQTMYVVFDNIEVSQPDDTTLYSTLSNTPAYKFVMEDHLYQLGQCKSRISHKGYVKLRSIDIINGELKKASITSSSSSGVHSAPMTMNSDEEFELDSTYNPARLPKKSICYVNGIPFSMASTSSVSRASSEYDYQYITAFNSHKPLSVLMTSSDEPLSTTQIPVSCISMVKREEEIDSDGSESELDELEPVALPVDEEEKEESTIKNDSSVMGGDQRPYFNSKSFLGYFINIFKSKLAFDLGFNQNDLDQATWKAAAIFVPPYEIIPAIHCPWPVEAFEWRARKREPIPVPFTDKKYVWPTPKMISDVVGFGCHVIPVGYAPKKGDNPNRHIEWKIVFPQAERYLEANLTSAQIKVYMIMKAVFKSFIETRLENGRSIFTKEHLRTQLFWLCEENFAAWNEEYLGEALMRYMKALLTSIKKHYLPDYFLRQRNLLDNVPERVLAQLHKLLYRVYENPVFYLISALRNLNFTKNFYPTLHVKKLYSYLIINDPLHLLSPNLFPQQSEPPRDSKLVIPARPESVALGSMGEFEKRDRKLKKKRRGVEVKTAESDTKPEDHEELGRRGSVESINVMVRDGYFFLSLPVM